MRVVNFDQGGEEWLLWRNKGIGSSDAPIILYGKHFSRTLEHLWIEKVLAVHGGEPPKGWKKQKQNSAMTMGKDAEPGIREWYENYLGKKADPICAIHDTHDFLKASLDGWVPETQTILEIKRPGMKWNGECDHYDALNGRVPSKYLCQIDHQFIVSGEAKRAHYLSYGDPKYFEEEDRHIVIPLKRNPEREAQLLELELEFWKAVLEIDRDYVKRRGY